MSVVGIGIDIVAVARIVELLDRHGWRFVDRCFRPLTNPAQGLAGGRTASWDPAVLAGRWAAKEAFLKALGVDARPIPYRDIEVVPSPSGQARLILHGRALESLTLAGGNRTHLALSQEGAFALASVLIEE